MTLRILEHATDADARLVAILMHKYGLQSIVITPEDEQAMSDAIEGNLLVLGAVPDCGSIELRFVADADVPEADEVMN